MQATVIKGEKSDFKSVSAGIPQGSVLGPLLFFIYINDIVNNIESVMKLFADDTSLSLALNNPDSRAEILNHDLEQINEWAKKWKVRFNEEKTEQLNFTRGQNQNQQLTFGSTTLKETPSHKLHCTLRSILYCTHRGIIILHCTHRAILYCTGVNAHLRVTLDETLPFQQHISRSLHVRLAISNSVQSVMSLTVSLTMLSKRVLPSFCLVLIAVDHFAMGVHKI